VCALPDAPAAARRFLFPFDFRLCVLPPLPPKTLLRETLRSVTIAVTTDAKAMTVCA